MGRGRKKRLVHPGQQCGPCHLCHQTSTTYCHIATWKDDLKREIKENTTVSEINCICRACERDFKSNFRKDGHKFRWMQAQSDRPGLSRCIVESCTSTNTIIHTGIATKDKVAELLHEQVVTEHRHLLTPLCSMHYRQVHRAIHKGDSMYTEKQCHTCHALIRYSGTVRHCPDPKRINQYISMNGDTDLHITENAHHATTITWL